MNKVIRDGLCATAHKAVLLVLCLVALPASAESYFSLQVGQSIQTIDHPGAVLTSFELDDSAAVGRIGLGYSAAWWGVEFGYSPILSRRTGHATIAPDVDMRQEITTSAVDLRGYLGLQLGRDLQARAIAGVALVHFDNHEWGVNPAAAEWRNDGYELRPLYGVGLRYRVNDSIGITFDATQIRGVAQSHWTLSSDVTTILAGLQVGF